MIKTSTLNLEKLLQHNNDNSLYNQASEKELDLFYAGISANLNKLVKNPRPDIIENILFFSKHL